MKWCEKLILGEYASKIVWVHISMATILPFWVDI